MASLNIRQHGKLWNLLHLSRPPHIIETQFAESLLIESSFLYNVYVHFLMIPFVFPSSTKGNEGKVWGNVGVWEKMENVL